jgi:hypothetical protein
MKMKKRYTYLGLLGLLPFFASAQAGLTNNGATIVIEQGATLVVEGGIMNNAAGEINNSGTIQVQGDFVNDGMLSSSAANSDIIFNGTAAQTFDANGASVRKVSIQNVTNDVSLVATGLTITEELAFGAGSANLDIAGQNLILGAAATVTRTVNDGYIKADGAGKVVKDYASNGSFDFPVGGDEYSPITVNAGTDADGTVEVNVEEMAIPGAERPADVNAFLDRVWNVDLVNYPANAEAAVTAIYDETADVNGTEGLIKGASLDGAMMWSYKDADGDATANTISGTVPSSSMFTGTNAYRRQAVRAFLAGPYNGTTMNTGLNSGGLIPSTSPYDGAVSIPGTVSALDANIVDWVELELRDAADETTVLSTHSKFVRNDGLVLNLDGSTTATFRDAPATAYIAVKHRNHLGVMTGGAYTLGTAELNFTNSGTATFGSNAQRNIGGSLVMWSGNTSGDDRVVYIGSGSDLTPISSAVFLNPANAGIFDASLPLSNVYNNADANLDGSVIYIGSGSDLTPISSSVFLNPANSGSFDASLPLIQQIAN